MRTLPGGRVAQPNSKDGVVIPGLYACGWIGTGPVGVIASTIAGASSTARCILEDIKEGVYD